MQRPLILPALAVVLTLEASSCSPGKNELHIMNRVKSPNGALTAAYVQSTPGGAALGTGEDVYVFRGNSPAGYKDRVFGAECVTDIKITWLGPRELRIAYTTGRDNKTPSTGGPWWRFGHVAHKLTIRLAPKLVNVASC
jgi:hypothetical protein